MYLIFLYDFVVHTQLPLEKRTFLEKSSFIHEDRLLFAVDTVEASCNGPNDYF